MTLNKKAEEKKIVIAIKNRFTGVIIFESTQTTWKKAVEEANLREANLRGADLREADLCEADLRGANAGNAKFSGKTDNPKILKKSQVNDFLVMLGFKIK